jgi:geranylgeranyl pyrophosphate synthase
MNWIESELKSLETQLQNSKIPAPFVGASQWLNWLEEDVQKMLDQGGKRTRPLIALWLKHFFATSPSQRHSLNRLALAVEILHTGSLAIDDIQDRSEERRGQATLEKQIGLARAVSAGNLSYFWALELLDTAQLKALGVTCLYQCHVGQGFDLLNTRESFYDTWELLSASEKWAFWEQTATLKTSALMELVAVCGGTILEWNSYQTEGFLKFLRDYGKAFQILDDIKNTSRHASGPKTFEDFEQCTRSCVFLEMYFKMEHAQLVELRGVKNLTKRRTWLAEHPSLKAAQRACLGKVAALLVEMEASLLLLVPDKESECWTSLQKILVVPLLKLNQALNQE